MLLLFTLTLIIAILLFVIDRLLQENNDNLVDKIVEKLPQAQCGNCGYPGCKAYAEALLEGKAQLGLCHLLDANTTQEIADLTGLSVNLNMNEVNTQVALINEDLCVGCTKCIQVCPTDCIIGSAKKAHTVVQKIVPDAKLV